MIARILINFIKWLIFCWVSPVLVLPCSTWIRSARYQSVSFSSGGPPPPSFNPNWPAPSYTASDQEQDLPPPPPPPPSRTGLLRGTVWKCVRGEWSPREQFCPELSIARPLLAPQSKFSRQLAWTSDWPAATGLFWEGRGYLNRRAVCSIASTHWQPPALRSNSWETWGLLRESHSAQSDR